MVKNYSPERKILWDLWFIKDKGKYHGYYLQSDRLKDVNKRHDNNVSIGHAVSKDLIKWKELSTALKPGERGEWDDLSLWTGSVIKKGSKYYMYYTGRSKRRGYKKVQKIGMAISKDLKVWKKYDYNPILEVDSLNYQSEFKENMLGIIGAFRDPFVFRDPKSKKYYMTISARTSGKKNEYNACIGLAESKDLISWKLLAPIFTPKVYDEMEVSQMIYQNGIYYLFFSVDLVKSYEPKFRKKYNINTSALHCYYSKNLKSGYKPVNKDGIVWKYIEKIYDVRLIKKGKNKFHAIGWLEKYKKSKFYGRISYPIEMNIVGNKISCPVCC